MKISLNLVKKFTEVRLEKEQLVSLISERLAEVEKVYSLEEKYHSITIGEICKAAAHPDAEKLGVYQVDIGESTVQVVAGDKTLRVGDKVAYLPPATIVPGSINSDIPLKIEEIELRGQISKGMLASGKELDFNANSENVLRLDTDLVAGARLIEAYELDDTIIEVDNKSFTNRPDCFGVVGFAREIAGIQGIKFDSPDWLVGLDGKIDTAEKLELTIDNQCTDLVPTYLAIVLDNLHVRSSPLIIQSYLSRMGLRPVNNIVDVTNYLMLVSGQPLHAFDYDKVKEASIIIRQAQANEQLQLLDDREVKLEGDEILICDRQGPIAIGGVMGCKNSEVGADTKRIILECANFDMYSIRRTSMRHGIFSEAVTRFSRGQSAALCNHVLPQAVQKYIEVSKAQIASRIIGASSTSQQEKTVLVEAEQVSFLLGDDIKTSQITKLLENVEFTVKGGDRGLEVTPPFWRKDITLWQDVAEEVGRLRGFDSIELSLPNRPISATTVDRLGDLKKIIRRLLTAAGGNELLTYSGISDSLVEKMGWDRKRLFEIENARSPSLRYMRPSLVGSLLDKVKPNHKRGYREFVLFEINPVHDALILSNEDLPIEQPQLALVYSSLDPAVGSSYFRIKKYLEFLFGQLGLQNLEFAVCKDQDFNRYPYYLVGRTAKVLAEGELIALLGEFAPRIKDSFKLPDNAAGAEIFLETVLSHQTRYEGYQPLDKYPSVFRDLTLEVDDSLAFGGLLSEIKKFVEKKEELECSFRPVEIFRGDKTKRRITLAVEICSKHKTLSSQEVNEFIETLIKYLNTTVRAQQI